MTRRRTSPLAVTFVSGRGRGALIGPLPLPQAWKVATFLPTAGLTFTAEPSARAPVTQYSFLGEVSTFCL